MNDMVLSQPETIDFEERIGQTFLSPLEEAVCVEKLTGSKNSEIARTLEISPAIVNRVLQSPRVRARIADIRDQAQVRTQVTVERVLLEFSRIGFANMLDYVSIDEDGEPNLDFTKLTRAQAAAIQEVTVEETLTHSGEVKKKTKFKLNDKQAALVQIGKHLGMFEDKVRVQGQVGVIQVNLLPDDLNL